MNELEGHLAPTDDEDELLPTPTADDEDVIEAPARPEREYIQWGPRVHGKMADGKPMIFNNDYVTALAVQWKRDRCLKTYERICAETSDLMDAIIRKRKFHLSAPFGDIKNHLYLQMSDWLDGFNPSEPTKLYSYISTAIKNGALSYVRKEIAIRSKMVYTDVPMEAFNGMSYTHRFDTELGVAIRESIATLTCRWSEPHVKESIRVSILAVIGDKVLSRRVQLTRTLQLAFGFSDEDSKFIIDWSCAAVRLALLDHYDQPLGSIDVLRASEKFSFMPDIVNTIGMASAMKLMHVMAGQTIKFPSPTQIRKLSQHKEVLDEMDRDPNAAVKLATKFRVQPDKVQEQYENLNTNIAAGVLEDHDLYGGDHVPPFSVLKE